MATSSGSMATPTPPPAASLSLVATCSKALTTAPLNTAELKNLPQHMLVQLLGQVVTERDDVVAEVDALESQVEALLDEEVDKRQERRYDLDPPLRGQQVDMGVWGPRLEAVRKKWAPRTEREGWERTAWEDSWQTNPKRFMTYGRATKRFGFGNFDGKDMSYVISSPLLLYRVLCLFEGVHVDVCGVSGYKWVWDAEIEHVETGAKLGFGEWKMRCYVRASTWDGPQQFADDVLELLTLLCDPEFPHPCGVVAGTVG